MRIEYIGHACLLIDTGKVKIATDPWFTGASYCGQWNLFPKPVNEAILQEAGVILISHGHEDHFHEQSLRLMPKDAKVFYPYSWYGGAKEFLRDLGFRQVTEALPEKTYKISGDTSVTFVANGLDSIIVIESGGCTVVNVNDALHSFPAKIIDLFVDVLKQRWPQIDVVLSGFGGASHFPNTIHCPGKNDIEIAEAREQLFAHNFCRIVHGLQPKVAVPFAADFALLSDNQRWINEIRFPREKLADYYREQFEADAGVRIETLYSGDVLVNTEVMHKSPYREEIRSKGVKQLVAEQYANEIVRKSTPTYIPEAEAESLREKILTNLKLRSPLFGEHALLQAVYSVRVLDVQQSNCFNIRFRGREPEVTRSAAVSNDAVLVIETFSQILLHSFASEWGGDAITIGYGCEIDVFRQETITAGIDVTCVRLLTRHPQASRHWKTEPVRIARQLLASQTTRAWAVRALLDRKSEYSEKRTNDLMREWLFRSKCEVCHACDLPLLDEAFAAKL